VEQEQSRIKAKGINPFMINGIGPKRQRRSHGDYRPWLQSFTAIFDPVFSQVATDGAALYIADLGG